MSARRILVLATTALAVAVPLASTSYAAEGQGRRASLPERWSDAQVVDARPGDLVRATPDGLVAEAPPRGHFVEGNATGYNGEYADVFVFTDQD